MEKHITAVLKRSFSLTLFLVFAFPSSKAGAQQYFVPRPDLRVAIASKPVADIIASYANVSYLGTHHEGDICSNIRTRLSFKYSKLSSASSIRWLDGARFTQLNYQFGPEAEINCPRLSLGVRCEVSCCPTSSSSTIDFHGRCTFAGLISANFQFNLRLDNGANFNRNIQVTLPDQIGTGSNTTAFEFGELVNNTWHPSATPRTKSVEALFDFSAYGGPPAIDPCNAHPPLPNSLEPVSSFSENRLFLFDMSMGPERRFSLAKTPKAAEADFVDMDPIVKNELGFLSISPQLFGYSSLGSRSQGLFGQILPIRISGTRDIKNIGEVQWEVFLTKADASFSGTRTDPKITVLFGTELARLWGNPVIGNPILKSVSTAITIAAPKPDTTGALRVIPEKFVLSLEFKTKTADITIDAKGIEAVLGAGLPALGTIPPSLQVSLPQCLHVGDPRLDSDDKCVDYGGAVKGFLSAAGPWKHEIEFDFRNMKPVRKGEYLSFPLVGVVH